MTGDTGKHTRRETTPRFKGWVMFGALLITSVLPCPECGAPLALHIWPLLPLFIAIRLATRRIRSGQQNDTDGEPDD